MKKIIALAALLTAGMTSTAAFAGEGQASGTYRVRATVPVACWVRPTGTVLAGESLTGSVVEACNAPGGFTVSASYRTLSGLERADLRYDGRSINLSRSGQQILRRSSMATIKTVSYQFEQVQLDEPLVLALTIQPL